MTTLEIINAQASCIAMLSECVDGLFQQLSQHITAKELDMMPEIGIISKAVKLQQSIGEDVSVQRSIEKDAPAQQLNENAADMQQDEGRRERDDINDVRNIMYSRFISSSYN